MIAVIAADELDTASSMPRLSSPPFFWLRDLDDLLGDDLQRLRRQESAKGRNMSSISDVTGKVAGERDEEQQRREQREEEVVGKLRRHRETVVLPEGLVGRALQDLRHEIDTPSPRSIFAMSHQKAWPMLK
jgi:hypothetical protein